MASFLTDQFKEDILNGKHVSGNTYKIALYTSIGAMTAAATNAYTATSEVSNSGTNYTTGGATLAGFGTGRTDGSTLAWLSFTSPSWANASFTAAGAMIYNSTATGMNSVSNPSIAVLDFGGNQTATAGTFTINFPATGATALIRIA